MFGDRDEGYDINTYLRKQKRVKVLGVAVLIATIAIALYSLQINQYGLSLSEIFEIILNHGNVNTDIYREYIEDYIVFEMYIPRMIACVAVGAVLAVGGAIMQSIIKNPLADSYTTGISSGALLGVTLYIVLGVTIVPLDGEAGMIVNAFIFALIPCAIIIGLSAFRNLSSNMIIFVGIGVMYFFSAVVTFLNYVASPEDLKDLYEWSLGSLSSIGSESVPYLVIATILMVVCGMALAQKINVLSVGDRFAGSVGESGFKIRALALILVSVFTAVAVCFVGTIGFIGLVVPNIVRMFVGSNNNVLIPVSALAGAILLLVADCFARCLAPGGLPVGLVTSIVGGPVMLYILMRQKRNAWG